MTIDISIEYDCSEEDFVGHKANDKIFGFKWIAWHTEKGREFLKTYNINVDEIHKRVYVDYEISQAIYNTCGKSGVSCISGGFYYKDKKHIEHY